MKRRVIAAMLMGVMLVGTAGCGSKPTQESQAGGQTPDTQQSAGEAQTAGTEQSADGVQEIKPNYRTVTEAMDWGPAITKVILDMQTTVDSASFTPETFRVSSERKYAGMDFTTGKTGDIDSIAEREVTAAYVSDENGTPNEDGTYLTIEMKIGPENVEGSPFNYDFASGKNVYVETGYLVSLAEGETLSSKDGGAIAIQETDLAGNTGNINVIADSFDCSGTYADGESKIALTYASYVPETAEEGKTPLIIWLHGAGEGGTDPAIAIMGNKVVNLATEEIQQYFGETGAEILAPQTPTMWLDDGEGNYLNPAGTAYRSYYTEALMGLIESYVAEHSEIDTNRIYIGGCSNGGYMTVNMLIEYPDYFAAAYPVCEAYAVGWLDDAKISAIKDIPMWLTAAKTDGTVPVFKGSIGADYVSYNLELDENGEAIPLDDYSNALYQRLTDAGAANVHYSLFENVVDTTGSYMKADGSGAYEYMGHWSWIYTLNNECVDTVDGTEITMFEWLSQQSR